MAAVPSFVNRDPAVVMAEVKEQMESMLGREIQPAQLEQLVLNIISYREILLLERFNAGMAQLLYQFSNAPVLDYIAALVAVERLPAAPAGCIVRFTLVTGHNGRVIYGGTRVADDNQIIFETNDDVTVPVGQDGVDILVTALEAGKQANGIETGKINKLLDPGLGWIESVSNTTTTWGGSDDETDEQLRERIKLAPSQFSSAGSRQSYLFHAMKANAAIIDVSVSSPVPGTVLIVPLIEGADYEQVNADVFAACNAEHVRPLTDNVIVDAPVFHHYTIDVELIVFEGADVSAVESDVYARLQAFADAKAVKLGSDVVRSHIIAACVRPDVYDVTVVLPDANAVVPYYEAADCIGISVTVTGTNAG